MDNYFSDVKVDTGVMDTKGTVHCTVYSNSNSKVIKEKRKSL